VLTGSKNALKGAGFFVGAALLATAGFRGATFGMAGAIAVALAASLLLLPRAAARAPKVPFRAVFSTDARINWLSAARMFLFGSRDVWFVLALPLFFADVLEWSFYGVGGFMAVWIIVYGFVQAGAPRVLRAPDAGTLLRATFALLLPLGAILGALAAGWPPAAVLVVGLFVFGFVFAANSAVHSYLVVHYAEHDRVSLAVGFYYMANALGRLVGTVLSGAVYQAAGLNACLATSMAFVAVSGALCWPLRTAETKRASDGDAFGAPA